MNQARKVTIVKHRHYETHDSFVNTFRVSSMPYNDARRFKAFKSLINDMSSESIDNFR